MSLRPALPGRRQAIPAEPGDTPDPSVYLGRAGTIPAPTPADTPAFLELPTQAPPVGDLRGEVVPRLAAEPTSLPGLRADGGLLGGLWIAAASTAGMSHLLNGTTAQDAYQFTLTDDAATLVLVVCDGLGSRPLTSQVGAGLLASYACRAAAQVTAAQLAAAPEETLRAVLRTASADTSAHRAAVLGPLDDSALASTVALCLLPLAGTDQPTAWVARVGDCHVFSCTADGTWNTAFAPEDGPSNMVHGSLPRPDADAVIECTPFEPGVPGALILTTDGLALDVFDSPGVRGWLTKRWSVPCGAARMLDALRYRRQGSHDDRTALTVWLTRPPEDGAEPA